MVAGQQIRFRYWMRWAFLLIFLVVGSGDVCFGSSPLISDGERQCFDESKGIVPAGVARKHARQILAQKPDSFVAEFVLGELETKDGNYPDAIRHLKKARELIESRADFAAFSQTTNTPWHGLVVESLAESYDNMDRLQEAVDTWSQLARMYAKRTDIPDYASAFIQALLKLGQVEEAKRLAESRLSEKGLTDAERLERRRDLTRVDFALEPDGAGAYRDFKSMLDDSSGLRGVTPPCNDFAFHARRQGKYGDAVEALKLSASIQNPASASHPYKSLTELDVSAGAWGQGRSHVRDSWNWIQGKKANVRYELVADTRITVAQFYLASGYPDRAEVLALPYVTHPVRSGFSSRPIEQWEAGVNLLCWSASRQIRAIEIAAAGDQPWYTRLWVRICHLPRLWREAVMARRIRACVASQLLAGKPLRDAFMLVDAPVWIWGDLCQVLGASRVSALLDNKPLLGAQKNMFLNAMQAEVAFASGRRSEAAVMGEKALKDIPGEERLLRARLCLITGESLRKESRATEAAPWFGKAYRLNPAVFCIARVRLPLSSVPQAMATSPFVRKDNVGPSMTVNEAADQVSYTLDAGDKGPMLSNRLPLLSDADRRGRLLKLHRLLFSPLGLLKESDYAALEGQAVAGPTEKPDRMDEMIRRSGG